MSEIKVDDSRVFASLSKGWVGGSLEKIDSILNCWLLSDYSQSEVFHGHITSLTKMIAKHGHDPETFVSTSTTALEQFLNRYYDNVLVDITYKYLEENAQGGPYGVTFQFTAVSNGQRINLVAGIEIADSKLSRTMQISNGTVS